MAEVSKTVKHCLLGAVLCAALLTLAPASALAHPLTPCFARADFLEMLSERYGETVVARGIAFKKQHVVELLTSQDGESWTIIATDADGDTTCLLVTGKAWQPVTAAEPIEPPI